MERITPLFPLHLVVFPNSSYSLHIFEARYKKMVLHCEANRLPFVLVPVFSEIQASIGTLVRITEMSVPSPDGSFDIVVKGEDRVEIIRDWKHRDGYEEGLVVVYSDLMDQSNYETRNELERQFRKVLKKVHIQLEENFWNSLAISKSKSFKIAEKSGLSLDQQIRLLALRDETERVRFLLTHFSDMEKYITDRDVLQALVLNDGYLNPETNKE